MSINACPAISELPVIESYHGIELRRYEKDGRVLIAYVDKRKRDHGLIGTLEDEAALIEGCKQAIDHSLRRGPSLLGLHLRQFNHGATYHQRAR